MEEKQTKKSKKGGAQPGAGRPKGSTNKVSITDLRANFQAQSGMSFEQFVNQQMITAYQSGDKDLLAKYIMGLKEYFLQEPTHKVDITSGGETLQAVFTFTAQELSDWKKTE